MATYIINKNPQVTGEHEVHRMDICPTLPHLENRVPLGHFDSCQSAIAHAKQKWPKVSIDGCANCIPACHTR